MTVKSKTAPAQDSAIESALAQNVALAVALAAAEEKANLLSIEVDTFDLEMDSITDAWNTGDDTVTAEAYSLAQIEFKRATSLYEAAQKSVTNLGRSFINTDKDLAELVAGWVEAANPGVPVTASIAMSGTPSALPAIYVVQSGKTEVRGGGVIAGRVGITYFRNPLHR